MEQRRHYQKNRLSLGKKKEDIQGVLTPGSRMPIQRDNLAQGSTDQVQHVSAQARAVRPSA